jgi:spermidine synthase
VIEEILKYKSVKKIDYVELDPAVVQLTRRFLPSAQILEDVRVSVHNVDGRLFVKNHVASSPQDKYDVVIVNLPDPFTAQLNRLYTLEFFKEAAMILSGEGIISLGVTSSENYISPELQKFLSCVYQTLKEVFPEVKVFPGDYAQFLACKQEGVLTYDYKLLMQRLKERGVEAVWVREYYLFSKLSQERISYIHDRIQTSVQVELNRDFRPICYYYDMILWTTYFKVNWARMFAKVSEVKIWGAVLLVCGLILSIGILKNCLRSRTLPVLLAVGTTGFAEIIFEVVVILSFQIIYGYMYYKLGIILTSFMVGLSLGGFLVTKVMDKFKDDIIPFIGTQGAVCLYPLILLVILIWLSSAHRSSVETLGVNFIFPFLPIVAGFIGGFQFPLANKIYLRHKRLVGKTTGLTYAIDLGGSCVGALVASAFLLPLLGIYKTCLAVALLNIATLIVLKCSQKRWGYYER